MIADAGCRRYALPLAATLWLAALSLAAQPAAAAEIDGAFVEALQQRGWDDTAVAYLDWAGGKPFVSPIFQGQATYFRAVAQVAQAEKALSIDRQKSILKQAAADFAQFAAAQPESPQAVDALRQQTLALARLAQIEAAEAERSPEGSSNHASGVQQARQDYAAAVDAATELVTLSRKQMAALPKAAATEVGSEASRMRATLQGREAEGQRFAAVLQFESALLLEPGSRAAKTAFGEAQRALAALSEKYRNDPWTRYYLGRSYQATEDYDKALGIYETVVGVPTGDAELRRCQARTHQYRTECLVSAGKAEEAVRDASDWLRRSRSEERSRPEWIGVAYQLAQAQLALAAELGAETNDAKRLIGEAREGLAEVARQPGEFQQPARAQLASLGVRTAQREDVRTFADAVAAGRTAVDLMKSSTLAARLAAKNNPAAVEELQQQAAAQQRQAQGYLETALTLADRDSSTEDLNLARYYLCWIYWDQQRYHDAAILGEYLAQRFPDSPYAAPGAGVALRAYEKLLSAQSAAGAPPSRFLSDQLAATAEMIAARWPDSSDAAAAANLLVSIALRSDRLADAERLLKNLPPASRAAAELSLGSALWSRYLQETAGLEGTPPDEVVELRKRAQSFLERGFEALGQGGAASPAAAAGVLYLAQIRLAADDAAGALAALEHPRLGPLTLIEKGAAVASTPEFSESAQRTALSAYLAMRPPQRDKAQQMMEALEAGAGDGADAQRQLTRMYVGLGVQLQRQMQEFNAAGQPDRARELAAAFKDLLARVSERADANNWVTQNWLAQTSLQLGEGLSGDDAKQYFAQAEAAYRAILASAAKDPSFAPKPSDLLVVRKLLGDALRGQEDYKAAYQQYVEILKKKSSILDLQQAAATALEQWGVAIGDPKPLDRAIRGDLPQAGGKNLVWGWLQLAKTADYARRKQQRNAASDPAAAQAAARYADIYFDARYHAARARFQAAMLSTGSAKAQQLATARNSVESMMKMYADLGGPKWKAAFEELLKEIKAAQ
ncbi:MAG: hypothetical protein KDA44_12870 [Planctomycetales bacterium]|nr:hypothetical protein [Planctomycetales bacterium]